MATEAEIEKTIEDIDGLVSDVADDIRRFSQAESVEIWQAVAELCTSRANLIRQEMGE